MKINKSLAKLFIIQAAQVILRASLVSVGTIAVSKGIVSDAWWTNLILGAGLIIGSIVYSLLEKYKVIQFILDAVSKDSEEEVD